MTEVQTVLGGLRGYRVWRLPERGLGLRSLHTDVVLHGALNAGGYTAQCKRDVGYMSTACSGLLSETCSCGFYAIYGRSPLTRLSSHCDILGVHFQTNRRIAIGGAVQLSGRVIKGSSCVMRGERMKVEAFLDTSQHPADRRLMQKIANCFDVPLLPFTTFLSQYPTEQGQARDKSHFEDLLALSDWDHFYFIRKGEGL